MPHVALSHATGNKVKRTCRTGAMIGRRAHKDLFNEKCEKLFTCKVGRKFGHLNCFETEKQKSKAEEIDALAPCCLFGTGEVLFYGVNHRLNNFITVERHLWRGSLMSEGFSASMQPEWMDAECGHGLDRSTEDARQRN